MEGILYWPGVGDRGGIRLAPRIVCAGWIYVLAGWALMVATGNTPPLDNDAL
jgi:hypothetical protein